MPFVSSAESARQGRPSALAVVETIAASGFSFWFAWKQNTVEHIVIASALAPFLLLRTRLSTRYTIRILTVVEKLFAKHDNVFGRIWLLFIPLIKIMCSMRTFKRRPLYAISSIPMNFYKNVFVLDFCMPPQVIPGSEEIKANPFDDLNVYRILGGLIEVIIFINRIRRISYVAGIMVIGKLIPLVIFSIPLVIVAFSFRFAVKSTALIWLPLLWIIHQSRPGTKVLDRIALSVRQPWSKLILIYSLFVVTGFTLKILLITNVWKFVQLDWLGSVGELATRLVAPFDLPLWQVTSTINAVIAWAFFFRAKRHLLARNFFPTEAWPEPWVQREYVSFQAMRTALSLYTIACTFYLAAATAWQTEWPPIRVILFPWSATAGE